MRGPRHVRTAGRAWACERHSSLASLPRRSRWRSCCGWRSADRPLVPQRWPPTHATLPLPSAAKAAEKLVALEVRRKVFGGIGDHERTGAEQSHRGLTNAPVEVDAVDRFWIELVNDGNFGLHVPQLAAKMRHVGLRKILSGTHHVAR